MRQSNKFMRHNKQHLREKRAIILVSSTVVAAVVTLVVSAAAVVEVSAGGLMGMAPGMLGRALRPRPRRMAVRRGHLSPHTPR